jgi:hypothetical protein
MALSTRCFRRSKYLSIPSSLYTSTWVTLFPINNRFEIIVVVNNADGIGMRILLYARFRFASEEKLYASGSVAIWLWLRSIVFSEGTVLRFGKSESSFSESLRVSRGKQLEISTVLSLFPEKSSETTFDFDSLRTTIKFREARISLSFRQADMDSEKSSK